MQLFKVNWIYVDSPFNNVLKIPWCKGSVLKIPWCKGSVLKIPWCKGSDQPPQVYSHSSHISGSLHASTYLVPKYIYKCNVARGFFSMSPPGDPWVSTKNFSPFGPAVWPARGNIHTNVLFYYLDIRISRKKSIIIGCNIWMNCLELNWFFYDPSWMLQLSDFVWMLRS